MRRRLEPNVRQQHCSLECLYLGSYRQEARTSGESSNPGKWCAYLQFDKESFVMEYTARCAVME